jgi:hypothetical protein
MMNTPIIIVCAILLTFIILGFVLKKKTKCTTNPCEDARAEGISRAKMNLDPKWNKGCVRDRKTGRFQRK